MTKPLRVGLIGCGNISLREHAPALQTLAGQAIIAVADPVEARREQMRSLLDLPASAAFADYRDLLRSGVDYVTLTAPQKFRRLIVEDCAQAGVHVLAEKPIATVPADAQAMIERMRAAGLRYGMVHNYLFYPEFRLARELIQAGAIGGLRHVDLNFLGMPDNPGAAEYRPQWRHDPAEAGGGILMDMVHALYLAEYFFDSPALGVTAVVDNLDHPGERVEDFTLAAYAFASGYASVNMWWGGGPGGVEFSGTEGRILIFYDNYGVGPFIPLAAFTLVNRRGRQEFQPRAGGLAPLTFGNIHSDFAEAVRLRRDPAAPAEAGLRSLEAALAAYLSGATGRQVALPLPVEAPIYQRGAAGLRETPVWQASPLVKRGVFGLSPQL